MKMNPNVSLSNNKKNDKITNPEIITQYFTNNSILNILKDLLGESKYLTFINTSVIENNDSHDKESYIINNTLKEDLLKIIKVYDNNLYDKLLQNMITIIY